MANLLDFLKIPISTSQDLSVGPLSFTTDFNNRKVKVESISFNASIAITENITITRVSNIGTNYNIVLRRKSLVSEKPYLFVPEDGQGLMNIGDNIKIQCTDANGLGIIYAEFKLKEA